MKEETKAKIFHGLTIAAMVTPPWNIFWWTIGGLAYYLKGGKKNDPSGDGALGLVLYAPVSLPMLPFAIAKEKLDFRKYKKRVAATLETARWLKDELYANGITMKLDEITVEDTTHVSWIDIDIPTGREETFRNACVRLVEQFPKVDFGDIVSFFRDRNAKLLLNEAWARSVGLDKYCADQLTVPCAECGTQDVYCTLFGTSEEHATLHCAHRTMTVKQDNPKCAEPCCRHRHETELNGYRCHKCMEEKYKDKWTGMSG